MKYYIYTLGCKVNTYESNIMEENLNKNGFLKVDLEDNPEIVIINTCTVTNTADNKSIKMIKRFKKEYPLSIIVATGCMIQNKKQIDGVDILIGNTNKSRIADIITNYIKTKKKKNMVEDIMNIPFEEMKLNNFNKTRAFVKIEDGCENFCSYCIIPYVRGKVRSKKKEDIINEVVSLVEKGHKEIVLTGIHTGHYGADLKNYDLSDLIVDLEKIKGLERIRISSIEITEITQKFLKVLESSKKLVDHMHIPLQSGSDEILKLMNRKYDKKYFIEKIEKIRNIRPNISITTDVIVGFPNETQILFNETIQTIKKIKFSKIHVFPYSRRKNTKADLMENQVEQIEKKKRVSIIMDLSKKLELDYMNKFIGCKMTFIPEIKKDGYLIGHTGNYLLVKYKKDIKLKHEEISVNLSKVEYPYIESFD